MATDQRISALPSVTSPSSTDVLPIVSAGVTSQVTVGNLHSTLATTGSNTFSDSQVIDGNLSITGTTTLGGNIVPATPRGSTLGTLTYPFADIFVSSGSINIAGVPGQPNTTLSNVSGNILISAGGMQLVGTGAFNAVSASFSYLSGTFTHIGSQFNIGDTVTTGSLQVSGSTITVGNNTLQGNTKLSGSVTITGSLYLTGSGGVGYINSNRILTDLDSGSFAKTTSNQFNGNQTITGSLLVSGSLIISGSQTIYGDITRVGTNVITGSLIVTGSLLMGGTEQVGLLAKSITNPNNYVIHQFLTSSYHGATYAFAAIEDSTGKSTVYSNYIVAVGAGSIASKIGGDSQLSSGAGAPTPSFTIAVSSSYAQFKVTDTGTFTYRGIVQLY
jgi:hypothetical protein